MLLLDRKLGEKIMIGRDITLTVIRLDGGTVRIAVDAPRSVPVLRSELVGRRKAEEADRAR